MHVVILAAGKGTRMGALTKNIPKPLLKVGSQPILVHTLSVLPKEIDRAVIVVGYLGKKIKEKIGSTFDHIKIDYTEQQELTGTASALWQARPHLTGKFLVLSSDNWYEKKDLEECLKYPLSFGVQKVKKQLRYAIRVDEDGLFKGFESTDDFSIGPTAYLATGTYGLDQRIFDYQPVRLKSGQYGLPQTVAQMAKDHPIRAVPMKNWASVNTPEDIRRVENRLSER